MKSPLLLSGTLTPPCVHNNTLAEQRAQIEQLTTRVTTAETATATHAATISALQEDVATSAASLTAMTAERDSALTNLSTAQATIAARDTSLTAMTAERDAALAANATTESRANRLLATLGHAPLALSGEGDGSEPAPPSGDSPAAVVAQYRAIKGHRERADFYAANKHKMFPSSKNKK